jgi:tetratricopeptide (TPR) repeat protein
MIWYRKMLLVLALMIVQLTSFATSVADPNIKFTEANKLYAEAKYHEAIEVYNQLIKDDYLSPEVYYNLGNANYKLDEIAAAILNYERALKLKPDFEDAIFNLKLANQKTIDKIDRLPELFIDSAYKNLVRSRTTESWAFYTVGLIFIALILLISYLLSGNIIVKKAGFYGGLLFLLFGLFCWFMASENQKIINQSAEAIVFAKTITVKSEPNETSLKLFTLHEGTKVNVLEKHKNWTKIKIPNGNVGWLLAKDVEVI